MVNCIHHHTKLNNINAPDASPYCYTNVFLHLARVFARSPFASQSIRVRFGFVFLSSLSSPEFVRICTMKYH